MNSTEKLLEACKTGNLKYIKSLENKVDMNKIYTKACSNGHLHICKWSHSTGKVDFEFKRTRGLEEICSKDHVHIMKWVYENKIIKIEENFHQILFLSCKYNSIDICIWLLNTFNYNCNLGIYYSCKYDRLEIVKFLYKNCSIDSNYIHKEVLCRFDTRTSKYLAELEKDLISIKTV